MGWPKKSSTKVKAPPPQQIEEPLVDDDDVFTVDVRGNNDGSNNGIEGSDFETEVPGPANNGHLSTPTQNSNTTVRMPCCWILHSDLNSSLLGHRLTSLMPTFHTSLEHPFQQSKLNPPAPRSPKLMVYQKRRKASEPTQLDGRSS